MGKLEIKQSKKDIIRVKERDAFRFKGRILLVIDKINALSDIPSKERDFNIDKIISFLQDLKENHNFKLLL